MRNLTNNQTTTKEKSVLFLITIILIFSPLVSSGKNLVAIMVIDILGLLLFVSIFWNGLPTLHTHRGVKYFLLTAVIFTGIYLAPVPTTTWMKIPGRELYQEIIQWISHDNEFIIYTTLSLIPLNTLSLLISCIPATALFLALISITERQLKLAIYALIASATIQGVIGLLQYINYDSVLTYLNISNSNPPKGTYLNQNHFTAFMEMAEPIALALMIIALLKKTQNAYIKTSTALFFAAISLLLTFAAFTTLSRMGTALLLLSIILSFWAMTSPEIRKTVAAPIFLLRLALLVAIVVAQLAMINTVVSTAQGMKPEVVLGDLRWEMFNATWEGIKAFFPFGSGPGTMPQIIPAFLPADVPIFQTAFINHAHNDYLELVFEMGILGIFIILAFFSLYIYQWKVVLSQTKNDINIIRSGAGIGILMFLIYSLTDFNLHTPANVIFLVFLCGLFFRQHKT